MIMEKNNDMASLTQPIKNKNQLNKVIYVLKIL